MTLKIDNKTTIKITKIIFSAFVHETEVYEKVREGILNFLPFNIGQQYSNKFTSSTIQGIHGNKITYTKLEIDKRNTEVIFKHLWKSLDKLDDDNFIKLFDINTSTLHLRVSKDELFSNKKSIVEGEDTIKIIIKFNIFPKKEPLTIFKILKKVLT